MIPSTTLAGLLALAAAASPQQAAPDAPRPLLRGEGGLDNDCFLPTDAAVQSGLRVGDLALARARDAGSRGDATTAARERTAAFEAWFQALGAAAAESAVWLGDGEDDRRLTEGASYAVLRRLAALAPEERRAWGARFEPVAAAELEGALGPAGRRTAALSAVERRHPATSAAARAALVLADRALEEGRALRAESWLERAARHAELATEVPEGLAAALAARRARAAAGADAVPADAWRSARSLALVGVHALRRGRAEGAREPHWGVRPGAAFLDQSRIAVQTARTVELLRSGKDGLAHEASFEPDKLLAETLLGRPDAPQSADAAPGWPLLPAACDGGLALVHGRPDARFGEGSNALMLVEPPREGATGPPLPRLRWAVRGARRVDAAGNVTEVPELAALAEAELQPGPVVCGTAVIVQARVYADATQAWLLAFDVLDGRLLWSRFLAQGYDLTPERGRLGTSVRLAAQPLAAWRGRAFAGTHLGAGALVDAVDGRLVWSLLSRRRAWTDDGWDGARPSLVPGEPPGLLWAPADSDRLYALALDAADAATPLAAVTLAPPVEIGEAEILLGGSPAAIVVAGRAGAARTVARLSPADGGRVEALYLGPEERFEGTGVVSDTRVIVASDRGVYLFDRTRELYLLDYARLPAVGAASGGDVAARGALVLVIGTDAVWAYRAEP